MAEIVELTKEQRLGELEELKRIKLLDDFEINKIKKQREYYEYKLVAQEKQLKDILKYIAYEDTVLLFLNERRKSRGIYAKKNIEFQIIRKICHLYQKAITRYPNNIDVWDKYIKFCKATDNKPKVTALWGKYVSFHSDKYLTWLKAGMWEWIENKNYVRSISYLTRGLQRHPKCFDLFVALIKVELNFAADSNRKLEEGDSSPQSNEASSLQKAQFYYKKLKKENLATEENLLHLLKLIKEFEFAQPLYSTILMDIKSLGVEVDNDDDDSINEEEDSHSESVNSNDEDSVIDSEEGGENSSEDEVGDSDEE